ncbi:Guanine nucleotide exchange factor vav2 [Homalodisca vitripennis]|nr:Guanine nucleotide exchange factor vav2 [Homalodisca vitripennis]
MYNNAFGKTGFTKRSLGLVLNGILNSMIDNNSGRSNSLCLAILYGRQPLLTIRVTIIFVFTNNYSLVNVMATNDLWKDCAGWLTKCGVLRPDHKANWPDACLSDLAYTLRDGVLLCNLLNTIEKGCFDLKDVNQKPQMAQFLCLRNIKTFLQVCQDVFGLKESDLFEPSMLFDLTDFYRVLYTLSKLSNCPKVLKKNIPGFSIHKPRTSSQEDIYRNLNASCGGSAISPHLDPTWMQFTIKCPRFDELDEDIYEDLCYVTFSSEVLPPLGALSLFVCFVRQHSQRLPVSCESALFIYLIWFSVHCSTIIIFKFSMEHGVVCINIMLRTEYWCECWYDHKLYYTCPVTLFFTS